MSVHLISFISKQQHGVLSFKSLLIDTPSPPCGRSPLLLLYLKNHVSGRAQGLRHRQQLNKPKFNKVRSVPQRAQNRGLVQAGVKPGRPSKGTNSDLVAKSKNKQKVKNQKAQQTHRIGRQRIENEKLR